MNFDDYALNWDTELRINRAKIIANEIGNSIENAEKYSVMEFGCGTGLISFNLLDRFKKITLIDSSKGMIDILNTKVAQCKANNVVISNIDITSDTLIDEKFDIIYNSMVLHHIHNTFEVIRKFYELLNHDGYLCIVDLNEEDGRFHKGEPDFAGHNGFNQDELKRLLGSAGFTDIESNTFYYDKKNIEGESIDYSLFLIKARKSEDSKLD